MEGALKDAKNDALEHVSLHTITLVFTDNTTIDYQVISIGLESVYEEAENHFLAVHHLDDVELSHLLITNQEGIVIARWEGVSPRAR